MIEHDGAAQPGRVSQLCFVELDGCQDDECACCCHDERVEDLLAEFDTAAERGSTRPDVQQGVVYGGAGSAWP